MPRSGSTQVTFRAGPYVGPALRARGDMGATAKRDLGRYYALIEGYGRQELRDLHLTEPEASAICDALNGGYMPATNADIMDDPAPIDMIGGTSAELYDADRLSGLGRKWGVDISHIVTRLRTLTPLGQYALIDAVERFWRVDTQEATTVRSVGLVWD